MPPCLVHRPFRIEKSSNLKHAPPEVLLLCCRRIEPLTSLSRALAIQSGSRDDGNHLRSSSFLLPEVARRTFCCEKPHQPVHPDAPYGGFAVACICESLGHASCASGPFKTIFKTIVCRAAAVWLSLSHSAPKSLKTRGSVLEDLP